MPPKRRVRTRKSSKRSRKSAKRSRITKSRVGSRKGNYRTIMKIRHHKGRLPAGTRSRVGTSVVKSGKGNAGSKYVYSPGILHKFVTSSVARTVAHKIVDMIGRRFPRVPKFLYQPVVDSAMRAVQQFADQSRSYEIERPEPLFNGVPFSQSAMHKEREQIYMDAFRSRPGNHNGAFPHIDEYFANRGDHHYVDINYQRMQNATLLRPRVKDEL